MEDTQKVENNSAELASVSPVNVVSESSNNVGCLLLLSEMPRFTSTSEKVKQKVLQLLSNLKDVELLQATEAVGIVSNYLFRVGKKSQEGLMMPN